MTPCSSSLPTTSSASTRCQRGEQVSTRNRPATEPAVVRCYRAAAASHLHECVDFEEKEECEEAAGSGDRGSRGQPCARCRGLQSRRTRLDSPSRGCGHRTGLPGHLGRRLATTCQQGARSRLLPLLASEAAERQVRRVTLQLARHRARSVVSHQLRLGRHELTGRRQRGTRDPPACDATLTVAGKTVHKTIPCFDDPKGTKRCGRTVVTMYTANQGADLWHILYAWHYRGSLYSLSEHVIAPYTYEQVVANLDRMMRRLELIQPSL